MTITRIARSAASAVLIAVGGMTVVATVAIDYMSNFWAYIGIQGVGFFLILIGSSFAGDWFTRKPAWGLFVGASSGWFVCWSWFLSFGLLIPIPLVFWAAISSIAYLASTLLVALSSKPSQAVIPGVMALGSLLSTAIMAGNSTFASDFNYVPVGVGAMAAGIIFGLRILMNRKKASGLDRLPTTSAN